MLQAKDFPSVTDVAAELRNINEDYSSDDPEYGLDVRLQVEPNGDWSVYWGDHGFDQDHRGYWGSGTVPGGGEKFSATEVARDLIDQAMEDAAMSDDFQENARGGPADTHAAEELVMFIDNTSELSLDGPRGQGHSIRENQLKRWNKGEYVFEKSVKMMEYLAEAGAKQYVKENHVDVPWNQMFSPATRKLAARMLAEQFQKQAQEGEYSRNARRTGSRSVMDVTPPVGRRHQATHFVKGPSISIPVEMWAMGDHAFLYQLDEPVRMSSDRQRYLPPEFEIASDGVVYRKGRPAPGLRLESVRGGERFAENAVRLYHVIALNERTGKKSYLTMTPVTHAEGVTIMRKQSGPHRDVRIQLEEQHGQEFAENGGAKRYVGDAVVTISYHDDGDYRGTIKAGGRTWRFRDLQAPKMGFRFAYDSPEAYDAMAASAVSFGAYYTSHNRGEDTPDWAPDEETADAISSAVEWAQDDSGRYAIARSSGGPTRYVS